LSRESRRGRSAWSVLPRASIKLKPAGEGRKQLWAQSRAATSAADFQPSCVWLRLGITELAMVSSEELSARVFPAAAGARATGLPESNGMALYTIPSQNALFATNPMLASAIISSNPENRPTT
jgi:hypothetical protein